MRDEERRPSPEALLRTAEPARTRAQKGVRGLSTAVLLVALSAGVAKLLEVVLSLRDPGLVFLAGVLVTALTGGLAPSIFAAILSVPVYDFFFVAPLYTFNVTKPEDLLSLCVFLVVAVLTNKLTARTRDQAEAARRHERTRVDVALAEKAKTEAVIEAIEDGLIVLDAKGVVVHVNEVACAILEVERARVLGQRFEELASRHPHYLRVRAAVRDYLAHPEREGERVEITLFLRGREHAYILRPTPFRSRDGSPAGLILGLQDVTYLRDQEARREQLLATLSHELRTPITSLGMALELLQRGNATERRDGDNLVEAAREDVERLRDVAQRLLDLSRAHAMTIALERRQVDLRRVVERVVRIFSLQARERDVTLKPLLTDESLHITGDETKLTWAISNLISNALRYTPQGGQIGIEVMACDSEVQMAVSDTGPGIPPEQQEHIFERFTQALDGGEIGSAGLGLAIVRDIVQAHGGRIHVESEVGRGSRFVLDIPRS